jgi:hypothetical protein
MDHDACIQQHAKPPAQVFGQLLSYFGQGRNTAHAMGWGNRSHDPARWTKPKAPGKRRARDQATSADEKAEHTDAAFWQFTPEEDAELQATASQQVSTSIDTWAPALWASDYRPYLQAELDEYAGEASVISSLFPHSSYHGRLSESAHAAYEAREADRPYSNLEDRNLCSRSVFESCTTGGAHARCSRGDAARQAPARMELLSGRAVRLVHGAACADARMAGGGRSAPPRVATDGHALALGDGGLHAAA